MITKLLFMEILKYFLMMFIGYLLVKGKILRTEESSVLSKILVNAVTPCVIINAFQIKMNRENLYGLLLAFVSAIVIHGLLAFLSWLFGKVFHLNGMEKASIMYSNAGNMIIPIVLSIFGQEWVVYSSAFIAVQLILLWSHGKTIVCGEKKFEWKKLLSNLNMISIAIGLLLMALKIYLPEIIVDTFSTIGTTMAPLSMLVIGMMIARMDTGQTVLNRRIYLIAALRLVLCPLMVLLLMRILWSQIHLERADTILFISYLASITPVCSTITQMTQVYGGDEKYAGAINVMTTLGCLLSIPLMTELYRVCMNFRG